MNSKHVFSLLALAAATSGLLPTDATAQEQTEATEQQQEQPDAAAQEPTDRGTSRRLTVGGYGEAVMTRNLYSDHIYRYKFPDQHAADGSHGRFDLPHVVLNLGYDFGHGWTMGMEIEFEHGGTESAVELDADESGEYEAETERGGEVALEQFWIQKSWGRALNLRMGEIIVPVGAVNQYHLPTEFFTVYRPEGEATILPNTWHQLGVSLWGRAGDWRYEAQFLSGLDSERFGAQDFVHYGAGSPYEFKIANTYAAVARADWYGLAGLRLGLSGYVGNTFANTLRTRGSRYDGTKGTLTIGAADFTYDRHGVTARGNFDWAHLTDAADITAFNKNFPTHSGQDGSPSKHQPVASDAMVVGLEAGYDVFRPFGRTRQSGQRLYVFGRYEYYDSMQVGAHAAGYDWCGRHRMAVGVNYLPMREVVVKAEFSERFFEPRAAGLAPYNDEPSVSVGIAYCGWFR